MERLESAGRLSPRLSVPFDRPLAEELLKGVSAAGAERAIASARERGVIPEVPELPTTTAQLEADVRVLRVPGMAHYREGLPCQDAWAIDRDPEGEAICAVVADGVSSVKLSHFGSELLAGAAARIAGELVRDTSGAWRENGSIMNAAFLRELHTRTLGVYLDLCERTALHPVEASERFLCTTLHLVVMTPAETAILALADGVTGWGDSYTKIEDDTARVKPGANVPPLIDPLLVDTALQQDPVWAGALAAMTEVEHNLIREAASFHVVKYGPTAEVLPKSVELATDGALYTDMQPRGRASVFPLVRLGVTEQRAFQEVGEAVKLFHLTRLSEELALRDFELELVLSEEARPVGEREIQELEDIMLTIGGELAEAGDTSPVGATVASGIEGFLRGEGCSEEVRVALQENGAIFGALAPGEVLRLLRAQAGEFRAVRQELRHALGELAARTLEEEFELTPGTIATEVFDDVTWLSIEPKREA